MWSRNPNPNLVRRGSPSDPGHALDVGAGEGADAARSPERGWQVIATDISTVALDRG